MSIASVSGIIVVILNSLLVIFQTSVANGAPWGHLTQGGQNKVLTKRGRIVAVISGLIFVFSILIVVDRVGFAQIFKNPDVSNKGIWFFAIFFTLGIPMNLISRSKWEWIIMSPTVITITTCCYLIAVYGSNN